MLGNVNHTEFTDTIFMKQALGISGGSGAISAARMLNVTRSLMKGFMDMARGVDGDEGILSGDEEVAEAFQKLCSTTTIPVMRVRRICVHCRRHELKHISVMIE